MRSFARLLMVAIGLAGLAGCSLHADLDPNGTTSDKTVDRKTTTTTDSSGNVIEKKTTETKSY